MTGSWLPWGEAAFAKSRVEGKPVLLILPSGGPQGPKDWEALLAAAPLMAAAESFVLVRVPAWERPDVHARYWTGSEPFLVLSCEGEVLDRMLFGNPGPLAQALLAAARAYRAPSPVPAAVTRSESEPVWTGAVGQSGEGVLQSDLPASCLGAVLAERAGLPAVPGALDLLLYAAREWADQEARARLSLELSELSALRDPRSGAFGAAAGPELGLNAELARVYWDAFALLGEGSLRETAAGLTDFLLRELFDPGVGAFRHAVGQGEPVFYAEGNAKAAYALLRASSFPGDGRRLQAAAQALVFLQTQLFDPRLGMVHARRFAGLAGLLGDNAWTALAFSESFLMTGQRQQREFADGLMRLSFQELWDRDQGGFVDRVPEVGAIGRLKQARRPVAENGAAFEALWRLHHLKGNANYRKWLEWGLRGLTAGLPAQQAAPLARVQDMMARGRMELELVGRPGEPETDALLVALHRNYLPRKIVSFVDPDDQDYILAHKLQADSYPRLFGCLNFKPKADARDPDQVTVVLEAIMSC